MQSKNVNGKLLGRKWQSMISGQGMKMSSISAAGATRQIH
jgi:hypothetical protein